MHHRSIECGKDVDCKGSVGEMNTNGVSHTDFIFSIKGEEPSVVVWSLLLTAVGVGIVIFVIRRKRRNLN